MRDILSGDSHQVQPPTMATQLRYSAALRFVGISCPVPIHREAGRDSRPRPLIMMSLFKLSVFVRGHMTCVGVKFRRSVCIYEYLGS